MFYKNIKHSGDYNHQTGDTIQETLFEDIFLYKTKQRIQQHMNHAEPLSPMEHVLCGNLGVLIDGLDLIGDISIGIVVVTVLQGLDPSLHCYLGMEAPCPSPSVPIVQPDLIVWIPPTVSYPSP